MGKDYYEALGIAKGASADEIKRAFRKKAHELHPDKGGDPAKFKEINEAYQVLSDATKRQQYDQYGQTFEQAQAKGGFSGFEGFRDFTGFTEGAGINFEDLGDLFGGMFGGGSGGAGRGRSRTRRGQDIQADLKIGFRDAIFGIEREVELWKTVHCDACHGTGGDPSRGTKQCPTCNGQGQVRQTRQTMFGAMAATATCGACKGEGKTYEKECATCRGGGVVKAKKSITVKVPAGIADGQTLRLSGEGEAGERGGSVGDLYLTMHVENDPHFVREGYDIHTEMTLPYSTVTLGTTMDVETLDGPVALKIPAGTEAGQQFRLRGKGVPQLKSSGRGDHLVHVRIGIPKKVNRRQRKLLEELQGEGM